MGVVYLAEQEDLGSRVAIKVRVTPGCSAAGIASSWGSGRSRD
jgi:hypothetical protein